MRDLVRHMGDVHRWAGAHVAERRAEPIRKAVEVAGPLPDDDGLLEWYGQGLDRLVPRLLGVGGNGGAGGRLGSLLGQLGSALTAEGIDTSQITGLFHGETALALVPTTSR